MAKRIMGKIFYKVTFRLASSLSIGSGENRYTDMDIIRDSRGEPYIPATAVAGVTRSLFSENDGESAAVQEYFGDIGKPGDDKPDMKKESRLIFYDARMVPSDSGYHITIRDSVKLDEYKTAEAGAKFDMEAVEPGISFVTYIEQNIYDKKDEDYAGKVVDKLRTGEAVFGKKGTRGYGDIEVTEVKKRKFSFEDGSDAAAYIGFDLYGSDGWRDCGILDKNPAGSVSKTLTLKLRQKGGISIRKYSTEVSEDDRTACDFAQLTIKGDKEIPIVPGTSWAGAIRHRMRELGFAAEGELFGYVDGKGKQKSKIRFGESQIKGANEKVLTRNAIDRFSGGTVQGALFTEKTYYGGTSSLKITYTGKKKMSEDAAKALAAALADLHYGFLAVGGETSIGRGLFEVEAVCGTPTKGMDDVYGLMLEKINGLWGGEA